MLNSNEYLLKASGELHYQMASLFHGSLMELLPEEYAAGLHASQMHPYSQHLEKRENDWFWVVNTLNESSASEFNKALEEVSRLKLKKHDLTVSITPHSHRSISDEELRDLFYSGDVSDYFTVRFLTPTAFKRQGAYLFYPDLFCVFQSLMNRCDAVLDGGFTDEDALAELTEHARIIRYRLNSTFFSLEGVRIPSFLGTITIKITGTATMKRFAQMLLRFGEYSGVGIKTSIGMGAIALVDNNSSKKPMKRGNAIYE